MLHIGHQRDELDIELEGKKLTQGNSFVHIGGAVCGDGKTEREVRQRAQAGVNAWRAEQKTKGQGHEHWCDTGMPVRNGNLGTDRTTTTKDASVRKQLGTKIARVTRADLQEKNGGVKRGDGSADELNRETGEKPTTVGRTR